MKKIILPENSETRISLEKLLVEMSRNPDCIVGDAKNKRLIVANISEDYKWAIISIKNSCNECLLAYSSTLEDLVELVITEMNPVNLCLYKDLDEFILAMANTVRGNG